MGRLIRFSGVLLLAALVLSGCGDSDTVSGVQKNNAEAADEICIEAQDAVGRELGDDAEADRDAIRAATDKLMAINAPSENENTWILFVQNTNNLWIALEDVAQSRLDTVNDKARADRALVTVNEVNDKIIRYAGQYGAEECAAGYGRSSR